MGANRTFVRNKATLPDLAYDYGALEPAISGKIMELHHSKHHQTYVNSYNDAADNYAAAEANDDIATKIALQPVGQLPWWWSPQSHSVLGELGTQELWWW